MLLRLLSLVALASLALAATLPASNSVESADNSNPIERSPSPVDLPDVAYIGKTSIRLKDPHSNMCLGADAYNGAWTHLMDCNDPRAQLVALDDLRISLRHSVFHCFDVKDGVWAVGTPLQMWDCSTGNRNQYFYYDHRDGRTSLRFQGMCVKPWVDGHNTATLQACRQGEGGHWWILIRV